MAVEKRHRVQEVWPWIRGIVYRKCGRGEEAFHQRTEGSHDADQEIVSTEQTCVKEEGALSAKFLNYPISSVTSVNQTLPLPLYATAHKTASTHINKYPHVQQCSINTWWNNRIREKNRRLEGELLLTAFSEALTHISLTLTETSEGHGKSDEILDRVGFSPSPCPQLPSLHLVNHEMQHEAQAILRRADDQKMLECGQGFRFLILNQELRVFCIFSSESNDRTSNVADGGTFGSRVELIGFCRLPGAHSATELRIREGGAKNLSCLPVGTPGCEDLSVHRSPGSPDQRGFVF
ncbi:hypothetical protein STEG23_022565 [Scotinomys teguina]